MSSVVIKGDTSGQITLSAPAVAGTNTLTLPTVTATVATNANGDLYPLTSGTAVASTSGTSITFTGIPSWAKRVTVMFSGVSTNGTAQVLVQIGAGSTTTTGYLGSGCFNVGAASTTLNTTGFRVEATDAAITAASVRHGIATLTNITGNTWCFASNIGYSNSAGNAYGGGSLALSGTLDRVVITTTNGTDAFDAGSINILYE